MLKKVTDSKKNRICTKIQLYWISKIWNTYKSAMKKRYVYAHF